MKYAYAILFLAVVALPLGALAHVGEAVTPDVGSQGFMMMERVEDEALGDELHEEMEGLMIKMMSGTMTEEEADRTVMLMQEFPGAHATMMSRMMGMGHQGHHMDQGGMMGGNNSSFGMMGSFGGPGFGWWITQILLWIFLALGIAFFWRSLQKNEITSS